MGFFYFLCLMMAEPLIRIQEAQKLTDPDHWLLPWRYRCSWSCPPRQYSSPWSTHSPGCCSLNRNISGKLLFIHFLHVNVSYSTPHLTSVSSYPMLFNFGLFTSFHTRFETLGLFTGSVFRIRILWFGIRIQNFRLKTNLDPGFWWLKNEKNYGWGWSEY